MDGRNKSTLIWLTLVTITFGVLLVATYAIAAPLQKLTDESALGRSFFRILEDFNSLQAVFGPVAVILIAGLSAAAGYKASDFYFRIMLSLLILGVLADIILIYFVAFDSQIGPFISRNSGWDIEPEGFRAIAYPFLGWVLGAFALGLGALLGVSKRNSPTG